MLRWQRPPWPLCPALSAHVGRDGGGPDTGAHTHAEGDTLCFVEGVRQPAGGEGHQQADQP